MTRHRSARSRRGISMVESLVAVTVAAVAGAALLTSLAAAVRTSGEAAHTAVARGLAEQLADEMAAARFPDAGDPAPSGSTRAGFDDLDDYAGWSSTPPRDRHGRVLGTEGAPSDPASERPESMQADTGFLGQFTREVAIERVRPDGSGGWLVVGEHTNFRRARVRVTYTDAQGQKKVLAEIMRIFTYVPVAP